jgi:hypothetical protein
MFCRQGAAPALQLAACQVATNLASALDGALALLKTSFVTDACKALRSASIRGDEGAAGATIAALLRCLAAVAAHGEGQRQLLRAGSSPALLDVVIELVKASRQKATVAAAMLLVRNLAFRTDNKSHFLADARCARSAIAAYDAASLLPTCPLRGTPTLTL